MLFDKIEFPEELLAARDNGKLLVFAGAGVSMGGVSRLPSFLNLVRKIEANTPYTWHKKDLISFDQHLGKLNDKGVKTHQIAVTELSKSDSHPNPIHHHLLRLFNGHASVRIVTTNFDLHFSTAATKEFKTDLPTFTAPAFPLGNDFSGLVYLHGSVLDPKSLVLTDRDYGRAYSTQGWARRFLIDALSEYTTLFIGYSYNDPPLHYLTRGMPPSRQNQYILTWDKRPDRWASLDLKPVLYVAHLNGTDHSELENGVRQWSENAKIRPSDHKKRIATLLAKSPDSLKGTDESYIVSCFKSRILLRFFYKEGLTAHWLLWAEKTNLLAPVFEEANNDPKAREYQTQLAHWYAKHAATHHEEALAVYMRAGSRMPPHLWHLIVSALHSITSVSKEARSSWIAQLCSQSRPNYDRTLLAFALETCTKQDDYETAILLIDYLLTVRPVLEAKDPIFYGSAADKRVSTDIQGSTQLEAACIDRVWKSHLKPKLSQYALRLATMAYHKLAQIATLHKIHADGQTHFDSIAYGRSAIEDHDQNQPDHSFDCLIEIARDSLDALLSTDRPAALALRTLWEEPSQPPLLKRLAIHNYQIDHILSDDDKLMWLMKTHFLKDIGLHHETFNLTCATFPTASNAVQKALLAHVRSITLTEIKNDPTCDDPDMYWHHEYKLIATLHERCGGSCRSLAQRVKAIRAKHPNWDVSEHPDFTHYSLGTRSGSESPITSDSLRKLPKQRVIRLLTTYRKRDPFKGPTRNGLLSCFQTAVKSDPMWGLSVARSIKNGTPSREELLKCVVQSWHAEIHLTSTDRLRILRFLANPPDHPSLLLPVAYLLKTFAKAATTANSDKEYLPIQTTAIRVFNSARSLKLIEPSFVDLYTPALSQTGGIICESLLILLSKFYENGKFKSGRMPFRIECCLRKITTGNSPTDQSGCTMLISNLPLVYHWDSEWTKAHLIPLFDWTRIENRASEAWKSFLRGGKWRQNILQILLPFFSETVRRIGSLDESYAKQLSHHMASLCLWADSNRVRHRILMDFLVNAPSALRLDFATHIHHMLHQTDGPHRAEVWTKWLKIYWEERLIGRPAPLSAEEVAVMATWCPFLGTKFPDAVNLLCKSDAIGKFNLFLLYDIIKEKLADQYPLDVARYLDYIITHDTAEYPMADKLLEISDVLVKYCETHATLNKFCDILASKGCLDEAEAIETALSLAVTTVVKPSP